MHLYINLVVFVSIVVAFIDCGPVLHGKKRCGGGVVDAYVVDIRSLIQIYQL